MMVKARDLQPGQVIRLEYGDYGNWRKFCVDTVRLFDKMVSVDVHSCSCDTIKTDLAFRLDEDVEVVCDER